MGLRENLSQDCVTQLPLKEPLIVSPETSIRQTVAAMQSARVGYALICDGRSLAGIFTERDLIQRVLIPRIDPNSAVGPYMTPRPVTVGRSDTIATALRIMFQGHHRHLPVVDREGVPVGVASVKHIVAYLVDYYPSTVYNLPPRSRQAQAAREGA
jgi:CBS domain-containing protein